jgi:hypothetical protein
MFSYDLKDYVKTYKDFIPKSTCESALANLETVNWQTHSYYDAKRDKHNSYDNDLLVSVDVISDTEELKQCFWNSIYKYLSDDFQNPWFAEWIGFTGLRYNKYEVGTEMRKHCDHIRSPGSVGVPILSIVASLNDDYEGGEFIMWDNQIIKMPAGSITIFPSNFLYPHRVLKVLDGTRYSIVSWVH